MLAPESVRSIEVDATKSDALPKSSKLTQDSTQELKRSDRRGRRRHRITSLFSSKSRRRSPSPLSPPKRWSISSLFSRRRAMLKRRSYNSSRRGFSTASLELELRGLDLNGIDLDSSSTSFASAATIGIVDNVSKTQWVRRMDSEEN